MKLFAIKKIDTLIILPIFLKFIYFERQREIASGGGAQSEERVRTPSRLYAVSAEPDTRLRLTNLEIMT